jgi:hypothetical protein
MDLIGGIGCDEAMSNHVSVGLGRLGIIVHHPHHPHSQPSCVNNHRLAKGYIRRREYITPEITSASPALPSIAEVSSRDLISGVRNFSKIGDLLITGGFGDSSSVISIAEGE